MEEFEDVLLAILNSYPPRRWPADIICQVFLAIERNPVYLKRYYEFADGDFAAANPQIAKFIKGHTGMKSGKSVAVPDSGLIQTYSRLE